ncbi:MAG: thioredoxin family protein [Candidatus Moranbacteria bacterium]|nr:thioredoxin family protein [Candidatus Moranbacteria bacterium]
MASFKVPNEISLEEFEKRVFGNNVPVMVFFFDPECGECEEYAPYVVDISENIEIPPLAVFSLNEKKYPNFRKKFRMASESHFLFVKDGKIFDEAPLNRRGVGIILNEINFVK